MRRHYLDNIRWATVLIVVLYHVIYMYNGVATFGVIGPFKTPQYQDAFLYMCHPWFMFLLFLVAGIASRIYLDSHTVKEYIKSRTLKLLVPSTLGVFVWGWVQGYVSMKISGAFEGDLAKAPAPVMYIIMSLSGISVLWFLQLLWLLSIVLALIRKLEKGRLYELCGKVKPWMLVLLTIPVYFSGVILNAPMITVYRFGFYGFAFLLGYFIFAHEEVVERMTKYRYVFIAAAVITCGVDLYMNFGQNYGEKPVMTSIPYSVYAWAMSLAVLACAKHWFDKETKFSKLMTKNSFGIYMFHYLPMSAAALAIKENLTLPAPVCYIAIGLAAIIGGAALTFIVPKIPVLRYLIMGIKKPKAKAVKE